MYVSWTWESWVPVTGGNWKNLPFTAQNISNGIWNSLLFDTMFSKLMLIQTCTFFISMVVCPGPPVSLVTRTLASIYPVCKIYLWNPTVVTSPTVFHVKVLVLGSRLLCRFYQDWLQTQTWSRLLVRLTKETRDYAKYGFLFIEKFSNFCPRPLFFCFVWKFWGSNEWDAAINKDYPCSLRIWQTSYTDEDHKYNLCN